MSPQDLQPVLDSGTCIACGACVAACPGVELAFNEARGMYQPSSAGNAAAAAVCPAIKVDFEELSRRLFGASADISEHGVIDSVHLAQSTNHELNMNASSGGLIKELLLRYLSRDEVDGVIALKEVGGLCYEPALLSTPEEIVALPGSIYHNLALDKALQILRETHGRFVLVAIPCQLEGIYQYVLTHEPALLRRIAATIGLICGWDFSHHALRAICDFKQIPFDQIQEVSYRGGGPVGRLRILAAGEEQVVNRRIDFSYQVAFDRSFNIPRCHLCVNHANFLADVVVGDAWLPSTVGTKTGISIVICRRPETTVILEAMADKGTIRRIAVTTEEITESQSRQITFGDFAFAYGDYLRSQGEHCPELIAPNRKRARPVSAARAARFHKQVSKKRALQTQGRYRRLRLRKATLEIGHFSSKYFRWLFVRVFKIKTLLGFRKEISDEQVSLFE